MRHQESRFGGTPFFRASAASWISLRARTAQSFTIPIKRGSSMNRWLILALGVTLGGMNDAHANENPPDDHRIDRQRQRRSVPVAGGYPRPRSMDWVKKENAVTAKQFVDNVRIRPDPRQHPRSARFRRAHSLRQPHGRRAVQLLARQGTPARYLAAHHAGGVPQGRAEVGGAAGYRRTEQGREQALGVQGQWNA